MDYKKKYDEALERARKLKEMYPQDAPGYEEVFPELRESEDERIRKELIGMVKFHCADEHLDRYLKWFEKQKEQKPEERFKEAREKYQVEWSEEDERMLKSTIWHISNSLTNGKNTDCKCDLTEWLKEKLKSLRPVKQEWSEEDEHRRKDAIYFLESAKKHYADTSEIEKTIAWLKSLPMKCPKSSDIWKPREEQMAALRNSLDYLSEDDYDDMLELYEQLKKLM